MANQIISNYLAGMEDQLTRRPKFISITQVILTVMLSMIAGTYVAIFSLMVWP